MGLDIEKRLDGPIIAVGPAKRYKAAIAVCENALRHTSTDNDAHDDAAHILEALGFIPIPDDVPLACGHHRSRLANGSKYALCRGCQAEAEGKRKKMRHRGKAS